MIMLLTILTLFIGGLVAWSIEAWNKDLPRWISVGTCFIASILIATLYFQPTQQELMLAGVSSTWYEVLSIPWDSAFWYRFRLGY
jgi:NADH:ubiquinone oxidoreductase subunit 4 (subunit M)